MKQMKVVYAFVGVFAAILLFWACKLENDAFERCVETLPKNECIRIFG